LASVLLLHDDSNDLRLIIYAVCVC